MTLNLGDSVLMHVPVARLIRDGLADHAATDDEWRRCSRLLMAVPLAFVAALRPGGAVDIAIRAVAQISLSMPVFYIGLVLLIGLARRPAPGFPVGGVGANAWENLYYLFLPSLTLRAVAVGGAAAQPAAVAHGGAERRSMSRFATAKGLSRAVVLRRHVLRNAWVSTITLLGLNIGSLVGGAVITETVFAIPGIGRLTVDRRHLCARLRRGPGA